MSQSLKAAGRPSGIRPVFKRKVLLHLWCDFRAAFSRHGVRSKPSGVTHETRTWFPHSRVVPLTEPPAQLNSQSPLTVEFKIFSLQDIKNISNSIYNVTSYCTLSHWPWSYYSHPHVIVVLSWEWCVQEIFGGLKGKHAHQVKKKSLEPVRGAVSSVPRLLLLFLC